MASISQIKLPNNTKYNINVPLVEGTGTVAGTWLGTLDGLTEYYDGLMILYKINIKGASTTTLNLNSLGAKTCYAHGTIKLTTHYPVNSIILLIYSANQNGGCWTCATNYFVTYSAMSVSELTTGTQTTARTVRADYLKQGIEEIIIDKMDKTISVTIPANTWYADGSNGYYNKVDVSGVTASDNYEIVGFTPSSTVTDNATIKTQLGYITYGETAIDSIEFIAVEQVPTIDLPIVIRRVL